jgi:hypothetical protein
MLSRPEIGTREHILLWCGGKDPNEKYRWENSLDCACGQYAREHYGANYAWMSDPNMPAALRDMNTAAQHAKGQTFGALYEELRFRWAHA